jgi:hypothetical protein
VNLAGIKPGDIVECDVRGVRFHALVEIRPVERGLAVKPLARNVTRHEVTARQVVAHWRRSKQSRTP